MLGTSGAVTIGMADSLQSRTLQEKGRYLVYLPPSCHDTTYAPRRYPVLYLLDGDAHFHSVTGLIQIVGTGVNGTFVVPEMIVVAIANTDRTRDMTPTHVETGLDGVVRAYNQSGLRYGFRYHPDDSHGSVPLIAEYDALRFIFSGYDPNMLRVLERPTLLREHFARVSRELGQDRPPPEAVVELLAQVAMKQDRIRLLTFRALDTEAVPVQRPGARRAGGGVPRARRHRARHRLDSYHGVVGPEPPLGEGDARAADGEPVVTRSTGTPGAGTPRAREAARVRPIWAQSWEVRQREVPRSLRVGPSSSIRRASLTPVRAASSSCIAPHDLGSPVVPAPVVRPAPGPFAHWARRLLQGGRPGRLGQRSPHPPSRAG